MLVFKKWLIPIELLNLTLSGLILAGLLLPKSKSGAWVFGAGRDYQAFESYLKMEMKRDRVSGLRLAIINEGQIIYQQGFGNEKMAAQIPVEENDLLKPTSYAKAGFLPSAAGDFRWQWGVQDGYCKIMITNPGTKAGVIIILNRYTGIKQAGNLAVKIINDYWGADLDPGAFNNINLPSSGS
jgi:hypothetical protein